MKNPIFDIENWKEIFTTLSRNKTRTFLTAFGIFWGTAMLGMLLGGAKGMENIMRAQFEGFATNTAFVISNRTSMPYKGFKKGNSWDMTWTDVNNIRRIPGIKTVSANNSRWGVQAVYEHKHTSTQIQGVEPAYVHINEPIIYSGRFINEADEATSRKVCVIGKRVASDLFGTDSPLGKNIAVNGIYYKVVGVCGSRSDININGNLDEGICIPLKTMQQAYNMGDRVELLMMLAEDGTRFADLRPRIEHTIRQNHPIHPEDKKAIWFIDISEQFEMVDNLFIGLSLLAVFVGAGTLLAGIIGVGNIMWIIVKERTQEIGIRRAIGAKPRDIIAQILSESVVLTLIAGMAGICFSVLVLYIAGMTTDNPDMFQLSFTQAAGITAAFAILGTAAGIIPSIKAMRIKPIEALNDK